MDRHAPFLIRLRRALRRPAEPLWLGAAVATLLVLLFGPTGGTGPTGGSGPTSGKAQATGHYRGASTFAQSSGKGRGVQTIDPPHEPVRALDQSELPPERAPRSDNHSGHARVDWPTSRR
jgi:hypothetical protein